MKKQVKKYSILILISCTAIVLSACSDTVSLKKGKVIDCNNNVSYIEILNENICKETYSVSDNVLLCSYLKEELEDAEKMQELCETSFYADYVLFDFNDDGQEDYLVSLAGAGYSGSGGNSTTIFVTTGEELKEVFHATIQLYVGEDDSDYGTVLVLNNKTDGFYDIVLEGKHIWQYNEEEKCYKLDLERIYLGTE